MFSVSECGTMAWQNGLTNPQSPTPPPPPPSRGEVLNNTTSGDVAVDVNSLSQRCGRWLELRLAEVVNDTTTAALLSPPPSPPTSPVVCPCLEDVNTFPQVPPPDGTNPSRSLSVCAAVREICFFSPLISLKIRT